MSGCWDRIELQDLSIITAAAIDIVEDEKIRISVQIFIPRAISSGETGEDPGSGPTFVREGVGNSLAEAVAELQTNVPRTLFWGQCRTFIFGKKLAETGIQKEIDFLTRHPSPRGTSFLYVSEWEAKEMLMLIPPLERYTAEALRKLSHLEIGLDTTLTDVDLALEGESRSVALPKISALMSAEQFKEAHQTIPIIEGTAIFREDKMVGEFDMKDTRGLLWLIGPVKKSSITVVPEGHEEDIVMMPTSGKVKFKPKITKDSWAMNIFFEIEANAIQNETLLNLSNIDTINKLQEDLEKDLKERVSQTIEKLQQEYRADVLNFGKHFHQKYPDDWKKVKDQWEEKFPEVEVNIQVVAQIRSPGDIGYPAGIPSDEVEE